MAPGTCSTEGGGIVVEIDLGIGEIGEDDEIELLGQLHRLRIEVEADRHSRRVRRVAQHHGQRLGDRVLDRPLDAAQERFRIRARKWRGGAPTMGIWRMAAPDMMKPNSWMG